LRLRTASGGGQPRRFTQVQIFVAARLQGGAGMTVRTAELLVAIVLAIMSAGIMWKSTELNIGWVRGSGPGGGAWPFWLAAGMLGTCVWTIVRWIRRVTP